MTPRRAAAFTLLELLVVVALLGVAAAVVGPHVGATLAGGSLRVAARELAASARYARTMALLHGVPVDLSVQLENAVLSVDARERDALSRRGISDLEAATNDVGYTDLLVATSARRQASLSGGFGLAVSREDAEAGAATNAWARHGEEDTGATTAGGDAPPPEYDTVSLADSIHVERTLSGVRVRFGGWRDVARSRRRPDDEAGEEQEGTAVVRYRANGTVRPHRWIVEDASHPDDRLFVTVNAIGRAKVEAEE